MPVSWLPIITPFLCIAVPLLLLLKSKRAALIAAGVAVVLLAAFILSVYGPGWWWQYRADRGDPVAEYRYAQWLENHSEQMWEVIPWWGSPDVLGGYAWLKKAAAQNYPPAVWLVGERLKHGEFVPQPAWSVPAGNVYAQPERGQRLIDHAIHDLGFKPPCKGEVYYWQYYRRGVPP
ncbi:MAG: hypothetical protein HKL96_12500 [Phycisphaerales bacterium]|nr:hypothetical protein [Phycisphaerales bacterium]